MDRGSVASASTHARADREEVRGGTATTRCPWMGGVLRHRLHAPKSSPGIPTAHDRAGEGTTNGQARVGRQLTVHDEPVHQELFRQGRTGKDGHAGDGDAAEDPPPGDGGLGGLPPTAGSGGSRGHAPMIRNWGRTRSADAPSQRSDLGPEGDVRRAGAGELPGLATFKQEASSRYPEEVTAGLVRFGFGRGLSARKRVVSTVPAAWGV